MIYHETGCKWRHSSCAITLRCLRETKTQLHSHSRSHTNTTISIIRAIIIQPDSSLPQYLDREDSSVQKNKSSPSTCSPAFSKCSRIILICASSSAAPFVCIFLRKSFFLSLKILYSYMSPTQSDFKKKKKGTRLAQRGRVPPPAAPVFQFKRMWKDWWEVK